jgi:putative ABC transport system substrate-binding protein
MAGCGARAATGDGRARVPRPTSPGDFAEPHRGFLHGLKETGYIEGENLAISYRFAENHTDRLPELADDLVRRQVAVIFTFASGVFAVKSATPTIPVVFVLADDPVRLGLIANIARPGSNLTGINFLNAELGAKRLVLLRVLVPTATRIVLLGTPTGAFADAALRSRRVQLTHLATRYAIPATYALRDYCDVGGLMSYGTSLSDAHRQASVYAGRISKARSPRICPSCKPASSN